MQWHRGFPFSSEMSNIRMLSRLAALVATVLLIPAAQCEGQASEPAVTVPAATTPQDARPSSRRRPATVAEVASRPPLVLPVPAASAPITVPIAEQRAFMLRSAKTAWAFVSRSLSDVGFAPATDAYPYITVWDMASTLASIHSARELGFITPAQHGKMMDRAFRTMERMPLYDGGAYNKQYSSLSGSMVDRENHKSTQGFGWSVLDHGRFLVWLKIVGNGDPALAARAKAIVDRLDMSRLVKDGYIRGEDLDPATGKVRTYQEGRVGYEQYAAEGFKLWGVNPELSLDFGANAMPVQVNGQTVLADNRGTDLLTSEPFVMMGLELGWPGQHWRPLSLSVLAAQEERYRKTGIVTMVSEDAVPDPPAYFYYYLLYREGSPFVVRAPGSEASDNFPRWVSAKAAFGYHALAPSEYTWRALQTVKYGAATDRGWTAGVYEGTRKATKSFNVNTAAIVLESAAYFKRGCPLVQPACPAATPAR